MVEGERIGKRGYTGRRKNRLLKVVFSTKILAHFTDFGIYEGKLNVMFSSMDIDLKTLAFSLHVKKSL